jgi:2'-5' RNA ligase
MRPGRRSGEGASALVVPVHAAGRALSGGDRDTTPQGPAPGMPYHVTVLYPFMDATRIDAEAERSLGQIAAGCRRFEFQLSGLGRFDEVLYITPRPAQPFVALTEAVHARWPQHPPYAGEFDTVIPHVTIATGTEPPDLATTVQARLPITTFADELWLLTPRGDGSWSRRARFALGGEAELHPG